MPFLLWTFQETQEKGVIISTEYPPVLVENGLIIGLIVWPCTDDVSFEGVDCDIDAHSGFER